jgi:hypothetical protein
MEEFGSPWHPGFFLKISLHLTGYFKASNFHYRFRKYIPSARFKILRLKFLQNFHNENIHKIIAILNYVGFEISTAVTMKIAVLWYVVPYEPFKDRRFGVMCRLHLQLAVC